MINPLKSSEYSHLTRKITLSQEEITNLIIVCSFKASWRITVSFSLGYSSIDFWVSGMDNSLRKESNFHYLNIKDGSRLNTLFMN